MTFDDIYPVAEIEKEASLTPWDANGLFTWWLRDDTLFLTAVDGTVPEIASRKHIEKINYVVQKALDDAEMTLDEIDAVAVTAGPGLVGALLVGVAEAKAIAWCAAVFS